MDQAKLNHVIQHLIESSCPSSNQQKIYEDSQAFRNEPDFINYLIVIISTPDSPPNVRHIACLRLKSMLRLSDISEKITSDFSKYIREKLIPVIDDANPSVRLNVGTILAHLAAHDRLIGWTQPINDIIARLNPQNPIVHSRSGAMSALFRIWEDVVQAMDMNESLSTALQRHSEVLHLAQLTYQVCVSLIGDSIKTMSHQALRTSHLILENFEGDFIRQTLPEFMKVMFTVGSSDQSSPMRVLLCEIFSTISCSYFNEFRPHASDVFQFINFCLTPDNADDIVREKASDFISLYLRIDAEDPDELAQNVERINLIGPFVPSLVPSLFVCCRYTHDILDELRRENDNDDSTLTSVKRGKDEDDEEENSTQWNQRRAAASALDQLSRAFRGPLFLSLGPLLSSALSDSDWINREAAVLVLGAISFGCIQTKEMSAAFPELIPYLIQSLNERHDEFLRASAFWTMGCFALVLTSNDNKAFPNGLHTVIQELCNAVKSSTRSLQKSACNALATIIDEAAEHLTPYAELIISSLLQSLMQYGSLPHIFDAIISFFEQCPDLVTPFASQISAILTPHYLSRTYDENTITDVLYAMQAFLRCIKDTGVILEIIADVCYKSIQLVDQGILHLQNDRKSDLPEDDHIASSVATALDVIAVVIEQQPSGADAFVTEGGIVERLNSYFAEKNLAILQSAHALIGDLTKYVSPSILGNFYQSTYVNLAVRDLYPDSTYSNVAANVCWTISEYIFSRKEASFWIIPVVTPHIAKLLTFDFDCEILNSNIAVCLGTMGYLAPNEVINGIGGQQFASVAERWVYWANQAEDLVDKKKSFSGFANVALTQPQYVFHSPMIRLADVFFNRGNIGDEVDLILADFVRQYRKSIGADHWNTYMKSISPVQAEYLNSL